VKTTLRASSGISPVTAVQMRRLPSGSGGSAIATCRLTAATYQAAPRRIARAAPSGISRLYSWPWRAAAQPVDKTRRRRP
jgi:hypothetical protein